MYLGRISDCRFVFLHLCFHMFLGSQYHTPGIPSQRGTLYVHVDTGIHSPVDNVNIHMHKQFRQELSGSHSSNDRGEWKQKSFWFHALHNGIVKIFMVEVIKVQYIQQLSSEFIISEAFQ